MFSRFTQATILGVTACFLLSGCSTHYTDKKPHYQTHTAEVNDPLEPLNRGIFNLNEGIDILIINPVAQIYKGVFPQPVRSSIGNFLRNLNTPVTIVNELLQGNPEGAKIATQRFMVNTTIGLGGVFDVATHEGLVHKREDWGQTFAIWGMGEGPYLVLPLIGPSNLRDTLGFAVNMVTEPVNIIARNADIENVSLYRSIAEGINTRVVVDQAITDTRENSLDPYATFRSAYRQARRAAIENRAQTKGNTYGGVTETDFEEYPDFED